MVGHSVFFGAIFEISMARGPLLLEVLWSIVNVAVLQVLGSLYL